MERTYLARCHDLTDPTQAQKSYCGYMFPIRILVGCRRLFGERVRTARNRHCMLCPDPSSIRLVLICLAFSLRKFINDENWYLNLNRARHKEPHARFVRPKCIHSRQMDVSHGTKERDAEDPQLALYVSTSLVFSVLYQVD